MPLPEIPSNTGLAGVGANVNQFVQALQQILGISNTGNSTTKGSQTQIGTSETTSANTSNQSVNGTTQQSGTVAGTSVADQIVNTIGAITGQSNQQQSGTSTTNESSPVALQALASVLPSLMQRAGSQEFSREQAIKDSKGQIDLIMRDYKEKVLPKIYVGEAAGGGYNGTTKLLLGNDAATRAAEAAAAATANNVATYATIENQRQNSVLQAINTAATASRQGTTTSNVSGTTQNQQTSQQSQTGNTVTQNNQTQNVSGQTQQTGVTTNNGTSNTATTGNTTTNQETNTSAQNPGLIDNGTAQTVAGIGLGIPAIIALARSMGINDLAALGNVVKQITGQDVNINDYGVTGTGTIGGGNTIPGISGNDLIGNSPVPNVPDVNILPPDTVDYDALYGSGS